MGSDQAACILAVLSAKAARTCFSSRGSLMGRLSSAVYISISCTVSVGSSVSAGSRAGWAGGKGGVRN